MRSHFCTPPLGVGSKLILAGTQARKEKADRSQQGKRGRGTITLRDLVDGGILSPGRSNMSVTYKGITYTAGLQRDGLIQWQGGPLHFAVLAFLRKSPYPGHHCLADKKFNSATAFSIHVKRLQTPNKQGDDGWKSVLYEGTQLDNFRRKYQAAAKPATAPEVGVPASKPAPDRRCGLGPQALRAVRCSGGGRGGGRACGGARGRRHCFCVHRPVGAMRPLPHMEGGPPRGVASSGGGRARRVAVRVCGLGRHQVPAFQALLRRLTAAASLFRLL